MQFAKLCFAAVVLSQGLVSGVNEFCLKLGRCPSPAGMDIFCGGLRLCSALKIQVDCLMENIEKCPVEALTSSFNRTMHTSITTMKSSCPTGKVGKENGTDEVNRECVKLTTCFSPELEQAKGNKTVLCVYLPRTEKCFLDHEKCCNSEKAMDGMKKKLKSFLTDYEKHCNRNHNGNNASRTSLSFVLMLAATVLVFEMMLHYIA